LIDKYKLGALDIQTENKRLDLMGAKAYRTEKKQKIKGVPKNAVSLGRFQYKYTTFFGQATHLERRISRSFLTRETIKDVTPKYDKGTIQNDGLIVPFHLELPCLSLRQHA